MLENIIGQLEIYVGEHRRSVGDICWGTSLVRWRYTLGNIIYVVCIVGKYCVYVGDIRWRYKLEICVGDIRWGYMLGI